MENLSPDELIQEIRRAARDDAVWAEFFRWVQREYAEAVVLLVGERNPAMVQRLQGRAEVWRRLLTAPDEMARDVKAGQVPERAERAS